MVFAQSQPNISLIADAISFDQQTQILRAKGNVRILYDGTLIQTEEVLYDQRNNKIAFPVDLVLTEKSGSVINASGATLSEDLKSGLIRGATLLIEDQFQLTSDETQRTEGRFTVLNNTVASTCYVCKTDDVPFWQIRARRAVHDAVGKRIYFERATLDFLGVPIFYAPRLRVPDPSVKRATGVLVPRLSQSSTLGYGIRVPFYIAISDHADATITPFYSTKGGLSLEGEYRQELASGSFILEGALAYDRTDTAKQFRSYLLGNAQFNLQNDYQLDMNIHVASDEAFLAQYGYGTQDRLTSDVKISKTSASRYFSVGASRIQSLRFAETDTEIPFVLPDIYFRTTKPVGYLGGKAGLEFNSVTLIRPDNNRSTRVGAGIDWERKWQTNSGVQIRSVLEFDANYYQTTNHLTFGTQKADNRSGLIGAEIRWPLVKTNASGVVHFIEPVLQLASAQTKGKTLNEDSQQVEFEDTNLYSFNRFAGKDQREIGNWANVGVTYRRYDPNGWNLGVTVGRVFRGSGNAKQFDQINTAGLASTNSDYVSLIEFSNGETWDIVNRTFFSDELDVSKNETRLSYQSNKWQTILNYTWLEEDLILGNSDVQHELGGTLNYTPSGYWSYELAFRENLNTNTPVERSLQAVYRNECVKMNFSVSRRYAASGILRPDTEYGLAVEFTGLGSKGTRKTTPHRCGL